MSREFDYFTDVPNVPPNVPLHVPSLSGSTTYQQPGRTVDPLPGDHEEAHVRYAVGNGTEDPQYPAESHHYFHEARERSTEVPGDAPGVGYRDGTGGTVSQWGEGSVRGTKLLQDKRNQTCPRRGLLQHSGLVHFLTIESGARENLLATGNCPYSGKRAQWCS